MIRRKLSVMRLKWKLRIGQHGYENNLPLGDELHPYIRDRVRNHWPEGWVPVDMDSLMRVLWNA